MNLFLYCELARRTQEKVYVCNVVVLRPFRNVKCAFDVRKRKSFRMPVLIHVGSILVSFWIHFGISLVSFWIHFGIILGVIFVSFWYHFEGILETSKLDPVFELPRDVVWNTPLAGNFLVKRPQNGNNPLNREFPCKRVNITGNL